MNNKNPLYLIEGIEKTAQNLYNSFVKKGASSSTAKAQVADLITRVHSKRSGRLAAGLYKNPSQMYKKITDMAKTRVSYI